MSFQIYSLDLSLIEYIRETLEVGGVEAIAISQLYGFVYRRAVKHGRDRVSFSALAYASKTGCNVKSVRHHLAKLKAAGHIDLVSPGVGKRNLVKVNKIELDELADLSDELTSDLTSEGTGDELSNLSSDVTSDVTSEGTQIDQTRDQTPDQSVVTSIEVRNKREIRDKNTSVPTELQNKLIQIWNEGIPPTFTKLNSLSANRVANAQRIGKGRGGLTFVVENLPTVLRAVRADREFWANPAKTRKAKFTFDTLFRPTKNHFDSLLDRGLAMPGQTPDTPSNLSGDAPFGRCPFTGIAYHEFFFPERTSNGTLRNRKGIQDQQRRAELHAEAEAFYASQQQETK